MITESYVLANCMHNPDEVIRDVYWHKFKNEFDSYGSVSSIGYQTPVQHIAGITFEDWKKLRYKEFRRARYASLEEQQDMQFHDATENTTTWIDHINSIKQAYPKP